MEDNWRELAACVGRDPAIFFPDPSQEDGPDGQIAKWICVVCPAKAACLEEALANGYVGIWGGMSTKARLQLLSVSEQYRQESADRLLADDLAGIPREWPWQPERECPRCGSRIPQGFWPPDLNGPNAKCDNPGTYNKGCRCDLCRGEKSFYYQRSKARAAAVSPTGESVYGETTKPMEDNDGNSNSGREAGDATDPDHQEFQGGEEGDQETGGQEGTGKEGSQEGTGQEGSQEGHPSSEDRRVQRPGDD